MHLSHNDSAFCNTAQDHNMDKALDNELLAIASPALEDGTKVTAEIRLKNTHRTVGTMLSAELTRKYGEAGLKDDTIYFKAHGSAGQSFGAFLNSGITFEVEGDANDYFGKGLCGGKLILYPPKNSSYDANSNVILGNVSFYGATSGESYIYGLAGERFCVRNSGAHVVVAAVGDHGCEYMTGGRVVILGEIGKNFAAGMSGGIAYIYDAHETLKGRINPEMVTLESLDDVSESAAVKGMIERYVHYTQSTEAQALLNHWERAKSRFIKVMPTDYKRVLTQNSAAAKV
jgi:glutamate synthase domain-containing protein 3